MSKVYQQSVKEHSEVIIKTLTDDGFFEEYQITNSNFAYEHLCEKLTEKFIENGLDTENGIFSEEEFTKILQEIIAGCVLNQLKEKGYINSYEDDDTEELFFLTENGRNFLNNEKKENKED